MNKQFKSYRSIFIVVRYNGKLIKMPRKGWKSISIPVEMVARIQRVIENRPDLGYRSVADFIIDAIRRRLEEISKSPLDR